MPWLLPPSLRPLLRVFFITEDSDKFIAQDGLPDTTGFSQFDWKAEKRSDATIARVIQLLERGHKPTKRQMALEEASVYNGIGSFSRMKSCTDKASYM